MPRTKGQPWHKARKVLKYCLNCGTEYMGVTGPGERGNKGLCDRCRRRAGGMDMTETHEEIKVGE